MITEKYITSVEGAYSIADSELAFVTILTVSRNGIIYKPTFTTPTGREYKYINTGSIEFGTPFEWDTSDMYGARTAEKVYVKYKA
jgi:hypothetical protein